MDESQVEPRSSIAYSQSQFEQEELSKNTHASQELIPIIQDAQDDGVYSLDKTLTQRNKSQSSIESEPFKSKSQNQIKSNLRQSSKVRVVANSEFRDRCKLNTSKLEELGESYSEGSSGQFHLDSLPAILTELFLLVKLTVQLKQLPSSSTDQDLGVLDRIYDYISSHFKSQFINSDRILLQIHDCVALVDRFLHEFEDTYLLADTSDRPPAFKKEHSRESILKSQRLNSQTSSISPSKFRGKSVSIDEGVKSDKQSSQRGRKSSQGRGSVGVELGQEYKSQESHSSFNSVSEQTKTFTIMKTHSSSKLKDAGQSQGEFIVEPELARKGSSVHFHMPSPKYADVQYLKEFEEQQEQVITLDDGLLNLSQRRSSVGGAGFSLSQALMKTIAEFERILEVGRFKEGQTDRIQVQKIIEKLKRQLDEEVNGQRRDPSQRSSQLFERINEVGSVDLSQQDQIDHLESQRNKNLMVIKEETSGLHTPQVMDLLIDNKRLSNLSPEEARLQNLQEIFLVYCRQHVMLGKNPTFDAIKKEVRILNLGEFVKFSKDFEFKLPKEAVMKIFKKLALYSREMYFTQFKLALVALFKEQNLVEVEKLKKEAKEVRALLRKQKAEDQNEKDKANNKEDSSSLPESREEIEAHQPEDDKGKKKQDSESPEMKLLKLRLQRLKQEEKRLLLGNEDDERIFTHVCEEVLCIDDPQKYRKKIKGFTSAFGDKQDRMLDIIQPDLLNNNSKVLRAKEGPGESKGGNSSSLGVTKQDSEGLFKPFLYKDQYRRKVVSVLRQKPGEKSRHLPSIVRANNPVAETRGYNSMMDQSPAFQSQLQQHQYLNIKDVDEASSTQSHVSNILYERIKQREQNFKDLGNTSRMQGGGSLLNKKPMERQNLNNSSLSHGGATRHFNFSPDSSAVKTNRGQFLKVNKDESSVTDALFAIPQFGNFSPVQKKVLKDQRPIRKDSQQSNMTNEYDSKRMQLVARQLLDSQTTNHRLQQLPDRDHSTQRSQAFQQQLVNNAVSVVFQSESSTLQPEERLKTSATFHHLAEQNIVQEGEKDREIAEEFQSYEREIEDGHEQLRQKLGEVQRKRELKAAASVQPVYSKMTSVKIMNTGESTATNTKNRFFRSNISINREGQKAGGQPRKRLDIESLMNMNHHFENDEFLKQLIDQDLEANDFEVDIAYAQDLSGTNKNKQELNEKMNPPKQVMIGESNSTPLQNNTTQAAQSGQKQSKQRLSQVKLNLYKNKLQNMPNLLRTNSSKDEQLLSAKESPERQSQPRNAKQIAIKQSAGLKSSASQFQTVQPALSGNNGQALTKESRAKEQVYNSMQLQSIPLSQQQQLQQQYSSLQQSSQHLPFQIIPNQQAYQIQPYQLSVGQNQYMLGVTSQSAQPPTFAHSRQSNQSGQNQYSLPQQQHPQKSLFSNGMQPPQQQQLNGNLQYYNFGGQIPVDPGQQASSLVLPQIGKPKAEMQPLKLNQAQKQPQLNQSRLESAYQEKVPQSQKQGSISRRKSNIIQSVRNIKPPNNQTVGNLIAQQANGGAQGAMNNSMMLSDKAGAQGARINVKSQLNKSSLL